VNNKTNEVFKNVCDYISKISIDSYFIGEIHFDNLIIDVRNPRNDSLTFCMSYSFFLDCLKQKEFSCLIITSDVYNQYNSCNFDEQINKGLIITLDPKNTFFKLHNYLTRTGFYSKNNFNSVIEPTAKVASSSIIAESNVRIGERTVIEDFVIIKENVTIGNDCRIQSGSVIGNDCLQCSRDAYGVYDVLHAGGVVIGNNVKIESNSLVCKHIFNDNTFISDNVKIGGLSHVTHGCTILENTIIAPNTFLGGGTKIGHSCFLGANSTTVPLVSIGNEVKISAGSVVTTNILDKQHFSGNFAIPHDKFLSNLKKIFR
jgi:UDP-3-O-[3-hydroxymyristoyl] glucosamine N-acyltransferase